MPGLHVLNRLRTPLHGQRYRVLQSLLHTIAEGEAPPLNMAEIASLHMHLAKNDADSPIMPLLWSLAYYSPTSTPLLTLARQHLGAVTHASGDALARLQTEHPLNYLLHKAPRQEAERLIKYYHNHPLPALRMAVAEYLMHIGQQQEGLRLMVEIAHHCGTDHRTRDAIARWLARSTASELQQALLAEARAARVAEQAEWAHTLEWAAAMLAA